MASTRCSTKRRSEDTSSYPKPTKACKLEVDDMVTTERETKDEVLLEDPSTDVDAMLSTRRTASDEIPYPKLLKSPNPDIDTSLSTTREADEVKEVDVGVDVGEDNINKILHQPCPIPHTQTPTLLGLSRDIRDQIFDYVIQSETAPPQPKPTPHKRRIVWVGDTSTFTSTKTHPSPPADLSTPNLPSPTSNSDSDSDSNSNSNSNSNPKAQLQTLQPHEIYTAYSLLLTNRQLHAETHDRLRRKVPSTYKIDVLKLHTGGVVQTPVFVPCRKILQHVTAVEVTFRQIVGYARLGHRCREGENELYRMDEMGPDERVEKWGVEKWATYTYMLPNHPGHPQHAAGESEREQVHKGGSEGDKGDLTGPTQTHKGKRKGKGKIHPKASVELALGCRDGSGYIDDGGRWWAPKAYAGMTGRGVVGRLFVG